MVLIIIVGAGTPNLRYARCPIQVAADDPTRRQVLFRRPSGSALMARRLASSRDATSSPST
jgi:hypothetical protein